MRTKEDYMKDLSKMKKNIFFDGERIDRLDERHMPCSGGPGLHRFNPSKVSSYGGNHKSVYSYSPKYYGPSQKARYDSKDLSKGWGMHSTMYGM
jgi:hypothetical protein